MCWLYTLALDSLYSRSYRCRSAVDANPKIMGRPIGTAAMAPFCAANRPRYGSAVMVVAFSHAMREPGPAPGCCSKLPRRTQNRAVDLRRGHEGARLEAQP